MVAVMVWREGMGTTPRAGRDRPPGAWRLPTVNGLVNVGVHRALPATRCISWGRATRPLPLNRIDDEMRPLNDTNACRRTAEESRVYG